MTKVTPFSVRFDPRRGQSDSDGDGGLALALERVGGGLETHGEWSSGGPFVLRRESGYRVVGWIRAMRPEEAEGSSGGWEAWGVQAPYDVDLELWPTYWSLLQAGPESRQSIAEKIQRQELGGLLPSRGDSLLRLLTTLHLMAVEHPLPQPARVRLRSSSETPLLGWAWLFGPGKTSEATLGPPRLVASGPSVTYEGALPSATDGIEAGDTVSPYLQRVITAVVNGDLTAALEEIHDFRGYPASMRRTLLHEGLNRPPKPSRIQDERVNTGPPALLRSDVSTPTPPKTTRDWKLRLGWLRPEMRWDNGAKLDLLLLITIVILSIVGLPLLRSIAAGQGPSAQPAERTAPRPVLTTPPQPQSAATTGGIAAVVSLNAQSQNRILDLLAADAAANQIGLDPAFQARVTALRGMAVWPLADRVRVRNAVQQLELIKGGCTKTKAKIDGFPAAGFGRAITDCHNAAAAAVDHGLTEWLARRESLSGSQP